MYRQNEKGRRLVCFTALIVSLFFCMEATAHSIRSNCLDLEAETIESPNCLWKSVCIWFLSFSDFL
jgi:hypothetical protein